MYLADHKSMDYGSADHVICMLSQNFAELSQALAEPHSG